MERVMLKNGTPAAVFLGRVLAKYGRGKKITNTLYADVVLTVNGHEVPFVGAVEELAKHLDEMALQKAEELVSEAGLAPIVTALRDARVNIRKQLRDSVARE